MAQCMVYPGDHVHLERMNSPLFGGESSRVTKIKLNEKAALISQILTDFSVSLITQRELQLPTLIMDLSVSLVLLSLCRLLDYPFVELLQEVLTPTHEGFCSDQGSHSPSVSGPPLSITLHPWLLGKTSVCFDLDFRSPVTTLHLPW